MFSPKSSDQSRRRRDEQQSLSRGECSFVHTDAFVEVLGREPVSFQEWAEENLINDDLREKKRLALLAKQRAEEEEAAAKREEEEARVRRMFFVFVLFITLLFSCGKSKSEQRQPR